MNSPLYRATDGRDLPATLAAQFYHDAPGERLRVTGELDTLWFRPKALYPLFWALEKTGILVAERRSNIPTTLTVESVPSEAFGISQVWKRRFYSERVKKFDVTVVYDPVSQRAVDLVGPGRVLALGWDLRLVGNTFFIDVVTAGLRIGSRFVWAPSWLWPFFLGRETFRQEVLDDEAQTFSIELHIDHPLFGPVFGYTGTFRIEQDPVPTN